MTDQGSLIWFQATTGNTLYELGRGHRPCVCEKYDTDGNITTSEYIKIIVILNIITLLQCFIRKYACSMKL